ncbi:MAG: hypothetical protein NC078_07185 [Ruminococcus sp.]|nr:hypothetical protein [Ruminococcus sp.]
MSGFSDKYRRAVDGRGFSPDFKERTAAKMIRIRDSGEIIELSESGEVLRRRRMRIAWTAGAAAACALVCVGVAFSVGGDRDIVKYETAVTEGTDLPMEETVSEVTTVTEVSQVSGGVLQNAGGNGERGMYGVSEDSVPETGSETPKVTADMSAAVTTAEMPKVTTSAATSPANTERGTSAGQGNVGQNSAGQGSAGQDSAEQGNVGQGNVGQGNAGQGNAGQGNAGQDNGGQGNAGQGSAGQGNAGQDNGGQGSVGQDSAGQGNDEVLPVAPAEYVPPVGNAGNDVPKPATSEEEIVEDEAEEVSPVSPVSPAYTLAETEEVIWEEPVEAVVDDSDYDYDGVGMESPESSASPSNGGNGANGGNDADGSNGGNGASGANGSSGSNGENSGNGFDDPAFGYEGAVGYDFSAYDEASRFDRKDGYAVITPLYEEYDKEAGVIVSHNSGEVRGTVKMRELISAAALYAEDGSWVRIDGEPGDARYIIDFGDDEGDSLRAYAGDGFICYAVSELKGNDEPEGVVYCYFELTEEESKRLEEVLGRYVG